MTQNKLNHLEIFLFCHNSSYGKAAIDGGCSGIVVDWELHGKETRQSGFDTEINHASHETLSQLRECIPGKLITRINNMPGLRQQEARRAMELGSNEIWLPMVRSIDEINECIEVLGGRIPLGIQVETVQALTLGKQLEKLSLSRVYIGLNDLHIDRGKHEQLFTPLIDGTLDRFRDTYSGRLGVAGITDPKRGAPIPQHLLLGAMARLKCSFGVARRSFRRDISIDNIMGASQAIKKKYMELKQRTAAEIDAEHLELMNQVSCLATEGKVG
jgi:hypothetical protein